MKKQECDLEDFSEENEASSKSSKDKKTNSPDRGKQPSLLFKITSMVPYKTVVKAHSAVVLKAENMADKAEWLNKLRNIISSKGGKVKGESGLSMRQSLSDGSLDTMARRPPDPQEEILRKFVVTLKLFLTVLLPMSPRQLFFAK
ncbi:Dynamin GTPase [Olea europaea subsp. europaea]|uniref:Dynamin GTPase n=1 Tax=Olea europaea subsp. europaea TaxID=158383 RepID=A0A8S0RYU1_OLEEU|nr:Dynamin GTPase [Olea europaea subsp. europaea]